MAKSTAIPGYLAVPGQIVVADATDDSPPPAPLSPQTDGTAVLGALDSVLSFIVASDTGELTEPPPPEPPVQPPPASGLIRIYRNPAVSGAINLKTRGLQVSLAPGAGAIDTDPSTAELYRLFYAPGGQRVFSYEPWS